MHPAAISPALFESELFGHERGAFTGASRDHVGLVERADGGTLFIDEIGELPLEGQVKLLRLLEDRIVRPVGARTERAVDVRFVAATNRDLEEEIERGRFRSDLYFRLAGMVLRVPPLRDRLREVQPLALGFLSRWCESRDRPLMTVDEAVWEQLLEYRWPGNVRELRVVIEHAALVCDGARIRTEDLPVVEMRRRASSVSDVPRPSAPPKVIDESNLVGGRRRSEACAYPRCARAVGRQSDRGGEAPRRDASNPLELAQRAPTPEAPERSRRVTNSDRPAVGDLIGGRFRIERVLGEGGYGSVVAAFDEANSIRVALKLVARASHARDRRRWTAECDTMRAIAHPNVTRFIESGDHGLALSYVAMELVDGPSLAAVLGDGIALDVGTAVAIACEMLSGLEAMHACRIVHRDVKPSNVVLTQAHDATRVVLVDFGLAHLAKVDVSWSRPTRTGTVVGTASYLAPEWIEGALGDARADIWSVGVILYEMVVGRPPFRSKTATRTMLQVLSSLIARAPGRAPARDTIRPVLFKALEKSADRRFASASAFLEALRAVSIEPRIALDASVWRPAPVAPPTETSSRPIPGRRSR